MPKILTISRSKWRRGGASQVGAGPTNLLNGYGYSCCLGFDALACGVPVEVLTNMHDPEHVAGYIHTETNPAIQKYIATRTFAQGSGFTNVTAVAKAIAINDNEDITDAQREAGLIPILKELGWDDVVFVD